MRETLELLHAYPNEAMGLAIFVLLFLMLAIDAIIDLVKSFREK